MSRPPQQPQRLMLPPNMTSTPNPSWAVPAKVQIALAVLQGVAEFEYTLPVRKNAAVVVLAYLTSAFGEYEAPNEVYHET